MIGRVAAAIRAFRAPVIATSEPGNRPLGSVRPLPESVRELARNRPAFGQARTPSAFPLVDANGITWAERARRRAEQEGRA